MKPRCRRTLHRSRMADVHYHIERPGPRSRYVLKHLLGTMPGWEAVEIPDLNQFRSVEGPKLLYGKGPVAGAFQIVPQGLLERADTDPVEPPMAAVDSVPVLFPAEQGDLSFDPMAGAFFLLARYEEYGPVPRDLHGRPVTASLHGARHNYLHRPVVDEWLYLLAGAWRNKDLRLPAMRRRFSQVATLDADNGAMYLGRPLWRSVGGAVRDLLRGHVQRVVDRAAVLRGARPDPYAVHQAFLSLVQQNGASAIVNFLVAPHGRHDHAIDLGTAEMRKALALVAAKAGVGLHPGYASVDRPGQAKAEKQRLEAALGRPVVQSRQHFLRMRLPETYRQLAALGIREEHSMGLHDRAGFRAGTCTPFPFFDLGPGEHATFMVHPFAVMDSALCYKLRLSPLEAVAEACKMVDAVREVQGRFISVWHERFLSGYGDERGWEVVAPSVLEHARP